MEQSRNISGGVQRRKPKKMSKVLKKVFRVVWGVLYTILRVAASTLMVLIITGCIVASVSAVYILGMVDKDTDIDLRNLELSYTTIMYANDNETGEPVEIHRMQGDVNRVWVDIEQMPQHLLDVTIAAEDKRFMTHQGVDWGRTAMSFVTYYFGDSLQGGSTITQQLIKNITDDDEVRIDRKIREILRALALEKNYSKEDILEAYLNVITFGHNTNGVQAASQYYFDKDIWDLSMVECCALISMTQNPVKFDLFSEKGVVNNVDRRKYILDTMLEEEMISQSEYQKARYANIRPVSGKIQSTSSTIFQSWFVDHLINEVRDDLMEAYNLTATGALDMIKNDGLRIYSTVDLDMQAHVEEKYLDDATFPAVYNEVQPQSGMIVMDYEGQIKAIVGGRGPKEGNRVFNRATMAKRHIGSTMKPISAYALAFESNMITFSTIMNDEPVFTAEDDGWDSDYPVNYYESYYGAMPIERALHISANTIPVKLVSMLTPQRCYEFLTQKLHVTTLVGEGYNNDVAIGPMALGSLTEGMTMLELAAAFQIYGTGGLYYEPHAYTEVYDSDGNLVLKNDPAPERAVSPETATIINKLMWGVVNASDGSGQAAYFPGMNIVGKTGTSSNNVDLLFVGLTPYYVSAVYLGYDQPERINYISYSSPIIWRNVMQGIHEGLENKDFPASSNVISQAYCLTSGDLATDNCPTTSIGWYKKNYEPDFCIEHLDKVSTSSGSSSGEIDPDRPIFVE